MKYLKILAVALIAFSVASCCSCKTGKKMTTSLVGIEWQLVQIDAEAFSAENNSYTITLSNENRVAGRGDCNRISGSYETKKGGILTFGMLITTRMACPDLDAEHRFINALESIATYEVDGNMLILFDGDGEKKMVMISKKVVDVKTEEKEAEETKIEE